MFNFSGHFAKRMTKLADLSGFACTPIVKHGYSLHYTHIDDLRHGTSNNIHKTRIQLFLKRIAKPLIQIGKYFMTFLDNLLF